MKLKFDILIKDSKRYYLNSLNIAYQNILILNVQYLEG
jgi:hypothetical protein